MGEFRDLRNWARVISGGSGVCFAFYLVLIEDGMLDPSRVLGTAVGMAIVAIGLEVIDDFRKGR